MQWALAFTLGLLVGFFYPRQALVNSDQHVALRCPEIPECPPTPACSADPIFVHALETYQDMLSKCYSDQDHIRDWLDSCRQDNLNLKSDNADLRSR